MSYDPILFAEAAPVRDALRAANAPMFVARLTSGSAPRLDIGTFERNAAPAILANVQSLLRNQGLSVRIRVRQHNPRTLRKIRSLEALLAATGSGTLVFDRTKALQRSEAILTLTQGLRAKLGSAMMGAFFAAERRTLFLVLAGTERASVADAAGRQSLVAAAEAAWQAAQDNDPFDVALRIGFEVPSGAEVIAVDRQTVRAAMLQMVRNPLKGRLGTAILATLAGATISVPALAADLVMSPPDTSVPAASSEPAVDEPNFSVGLLSGVARDPILFDHLWAGVEAKGTIPLGERFGAQLDVGLATDQYYGAALHLFARDPAMGLVGIVGSAESQYGVTMNRIGAEFEYYLSDNFTIGARAGYQGGTSPNGAFGRLDVKFYPDPNLALTGGLEAQPTFALARAGFEWRPAIDGLAGMSVSADGSMTSTGDYRAMFGLHFQIGGSETLRDRDRKSDPESAIFNKIDVSSAVPKAGYGGSPPS